MPMFFTILSHILLPVETLAKELNKLGLRLAQSK